MKFFFFSKGANCAGLALRVKEEGHEVRMYIKEPYAKPTLEGMIEQVDSPGAGLVWKPDCIVFDMVGMGAMADNWAKMGHNVIGAGRWHDRIEYDRAFAMKFAANIGIKVPPFTSFTSVKDAVKFIEKQEKRYVLKPNDNAATSLTYVSRGPDDMIRFLEWAEEHHNLTDFLLQEFIDGIELSTEAWFSQGVPVYPTNGTMELKKFMVGDVGPNTGCMSSVVWPYHPKEPRIIQQTLKKAYPALKAIKYTGPLDVNSIVDSKGQAWFLEFTARFGYSAIYALCDLMDQDVSQFLYDCSCGKLEKIKMREEFAMALRLTIPPFPLDKEGVKNHPFYKATEGKTINKLPKGHSYLLDAKLDKDGQLITAGVDGIIAEVTYSHEQLHTCSDRLYEMVKKVEIADLQYRTDASKRAEEQLPRLKSMGYEVPDPYYGYKSPALNGATPVAMAR